MAYGFIDDDLWNHPKARSYSPTEGWLWVLCLSFVRKQGSGGFISHDDALIVAAMHKIPNPAEVLSSLAGKRGLDAAPDGYFIHNYKGVYERQKKAGSARAATASREKGRFTSLTSLNTSQTTPAVGPAPNTYTNTYTNTGVSLEELRLRAEKRGVASEGLPERLADLQQRVEGKGVHHWIPYVLSGFNGAACLFDQAVSRWLEEDHAARKAAEREAPDLIPLRLKRMEEA